MSRRPIVRDAIPIALLILLMLPSPAAAAGIPGDALPETAGVGDAYRLYDAGRLAEAEAAFKAVIAREPDSLDAREGLTWTYLQQGKIEEAARAADARLALAPADEAWRQRWIEIIHQVPSRRDEAVAAARAFAAQRPQDPEARLLLARLLSWTPGGEQEAKEILDALIAEDARDAAALYERSEIARWSGDYETANALLRRAAEADPGNARIRAALDAVETQAAQLSAARRGISLPIVGTLVLFCVLIGTTSRQISPRVYAALVACTFLLLGLGLLWLYRFPYQ